MKPLERTDDIKLNALIGVIDRFRGKPIHDNPHNPLSKKPRIHYLGVTDLSLSEAEVTAVGGAVIEDTLINPRLWNDLVHVESRVGSAEGSGLATKSEFLPVKNNVGVLENIVARTINETYPEALRNYYNHLGESAVISPIFMPNLALAPQERFFEKLRQHRIPTAKLIKAAQECSRILSGDENEGRVKILVHDEVRRYANSQGTAILDSFFGYHVQFSVKTYDSEKRSINVYQNIFFTDRNPLDTNRIVSFARKMARWVEERKECAVVPTAIYPIFYDADAMATELHESFVHLLASDEILQTPSTVWGHENYGKMVSNSHLSVYADPGMEGAWGSLKFDAEGVRAQRRPLVKNGVIVGYLADRNGAYHLSALTGEKILAGDARFEVTLAGDHFQTQPRITNLDFTWNNGSKTVSKNKLWKSFIQHLKRTGQKGLYIPDGAGAESSMEDGQIRSNFNFPYLVSSDGSTVPVKFGSTLNYAHLFVKNIQAMASPRVYCPHYCGDREYQGYARAGIRCGSGWVDNVQVVAERKSQRRQQIVRIDP